MELLQDATCCFRNNLSYLVRVTVVFLRVKHVYHGAFIAFHRVKLAYGGAFIAYHRVKHEYGDAFIAYGGDIHVFHRVKVAYRGIKPYFQRFTVESELLLHLTQIEHVDGPKVSNWAYFSLAYFALNFW